MKKKVALITGITGQDGSYLARFLLDKGYDEVHGFIRRTSQTGNTKRIDDIYEDPHVPGRRLFLHYGELTDPLNIIGIVREVQPDEIYNLAAMSHVAVSSKQPHYTAMADAVGALNLLESIHILHMEKKTRFYQASTSEMFGGLSETAPQSEGTPFFPLSPYACAKAYAHHMTVLYRKSYGMHASCGILFNHESPERGETFVTRKVTMALSSIKLGLQKKLYLGNMDAKRDWGYAPDYVRGMWLMLQQEEPDDYVLATGETHTVREFVEECAPILGMKIRWEGKGVHEKGIDAKTGKVVIEIDPQYFRPAEVDLLLGDASKAREKLGWIPQIKFKELVRIMTEADLRAEQKKMK